MCRAVVLWLFVSLAAPLAAQQTSAGPENEKAQKTYKEAFAYLQQHRTDAALDSFKKADKQDGGRCLPCQKNMIKYGVELHDWKTAEFAAGEIVTEAQVARDVAVAHCQLGIILIDAGLDRHKAELFARAHDEMTKALAADASFSDALFADGQALAHLKQDDAAKAQFMRYVQMGPPNDPRRQRALRYISDPELARAKTAPPFSVTTMGGQHVSLDDLQGKVVLIDFWATWCGPCREALPRVREIAKKFQGQPLVILSVSLDADQRQWKEFVAKNEMTWLNYCDGGFTGPIARLFGVQAIPHTFIIDADGVLQEEHIGDAAIEGRLKKLVARARQVQPAPPPAQ